MENSQIPVIQPQEDTAPEIDPEELFNQGLFDLKENNTDLAVKKLGKSLQIISAKRGELDMSLYKYYYHYADALLVQYEEEQGDNLFGTELPEEEEYSNDEENESGSAEEGESQEGSQENEENNSEGEEESNEQQSESEEEPEEEEEQQPSPPEEQQNPSADKKDELEDLQIVWENLETCRIILKSNQNDPEYLLKTYTRLGDVKNWNEDFNGACEEYSEALGLLLQLEGDIFSRRKAELYFLIGTTHLNQPGKEKEAAESFTKALEQLEMVKMRIFDYEIIKELTDVIEEVKMKREDAIEQEQSLKILQEEKEQEEKANEGFASSAISGDVKDLGTFGKRKKEQNNGENKDIIAKNEAEKPSIFGGPVVDIGIFGKRKAEPEALFKNLAKPEESEVKDLGIFGKRQREESQENVNTNAKEGDPSKHPKINP
ncbi:unnamed protein product [Blepharisma stoltei]|uniref:Tetratricopeptide SHNi-TPR domain-containing protein n=1 Tax=Blepharisma stoltei TaxID=1481888 RepID=A0AAU9IL31_9CILI|nr:unnamed protein product [Blepharisma stoltei]